MKMLWAVLVAEAVEGLDLGGALAVDQLAEIASVGPVEEKLAKVLDLPIGHFNLARNVLGADRDVVARFRNVSSRVPKRPREMAFDISHRKLAGIEERLEDGALELSSQNLALVQEGGGWSVDVLVGVPVVVRSNDVRMGRADDVLNRLPSRCTGVGDHDVGQRLRKSCDLLIQLYLRGLGEAAVALLSCISGSGSLLEEHKVCLLINTGRRAAQRTLATFLRSFPHLVALEAALLK